MLELQFSTNMLSNGQRDGWSADLQLEAAAFAIAPDE
jgi:hypothetical protein